MNHFSLSWSVFVICSLHQERELKKEIMSPELHLFSILCRRPFFPLPQTALLTVSSFSFLAKSEKKLKRKQADVEEEAAAAEPAEPVSEKKKKKKAKTSNDE